jgi:hypothetical protein
MNELKMNMNPQTVAVDDDARRAFEKMQPKLLKLEPDQLVRMTTELTKAAAMALAAEEKIRELVPVIAAECPKFDLGHLEHLRDIALCAMYVDGAAYDVEVDEMSAWIEEATELRRSLMIQAKALADRGLLDADRVASVRMGRGHHDLANAMFALSSLYRDAWSAVGDKSLVEVKELDRATSLGAQILRGLAKSEAGMSEGGTTATDMRVRAYSLLANTYAQVRRVVAFVRFDEGDANAFAPSIYGRRGPGRREAVVEAKDAGAPPGAVAAAPVVHAMPVVPPVANGASASGSPANG